MSNRKRNQSAAEDLGSSRGFKRIRSTTGCLSLKNISQHNRTSGDVSNDISSASPTLVGSNPHDLSDNEWPVIQENFDISIHGARVSSSNNPTSQRRNSDFTPNSLHLESRSRYLAPFLSRHGILLSQFENMEQRSRRGISNFRRIVDEIPESVRNEGSYETDSEGRTVRRCAHPISQRANSLSSTASSSSFASSTTLSIQPSTSPSSSNTISDDGSVSDSDESNTSSSSSTSSGSQSESRSSTPFPYNFPITHSPTGLPPIFRPSQPTNQNYNDIQSRIANLLPALRAANQTLEQERANGKLADRDIENLGEEEGEYIEMNLGLGVLEEKRVFCEGAETESDGESESENDEQSDDEDTQNKNVLSRLLGIRTTEKKPDIEVL